MTPSQNLKFFRTTEKSLANKREIARYIISRNIVNVCKGVSLSDWIFKIIIKIIKTRPNKDVEMKEEKKVVYSARIDKIPIIPLFFKSELAIILVLLFNIYILLNSFDLISETVNILM